MAPTPFESLEQAQKLTESAFAAVRAELDRARQTADASAVRERSERERRIAAEKRVVELQKERLAHAETLTARERELCEAMDKMRRLEEELELAQAARAKRQADESDPEDAPPAKRARVDLSIAPPRPSQVDVSARKQATPKAHLSKSATNSASGSKTPAVPKVHRATPALAALALTSPSQGPPNNAMKEEPDRDSSSSSGTEAPRSIDDEYRRELEHACVTENLAEMHGLPVAKRRERLRFRERNMLQFSPISAHQVQLPVGDSVLYALGPDLFIEAYTPYGATAPRTRIRAISLLGPNHRAKEIDVGIPILDFLVLIAERDLLVLLTKFGDRDIRLECWTYTSGTLGHTQAKHPSFLLELDLPSNTPSTSIAAVSSALIDNMVAVSFMTKNKKFGLTYYDWQLTFYDWQLGIRLCTPGRIGALGTAFVSPQHLLTTSLDMSCLEVLRVPGPRGDNPPVHLDHLVKVSFQLPPLCPGHEIQRCSMQMNGQEPSSSPLACPPHSPFLPRPADALILVLMDIGPNENDATKHCLIIRRAPFLHYVKTLQHLKQNRFVPWKDWGPKCARWIDTQHSSGCSISSLMGQHMVILDKHADDKKDTTVSLCILDFNESIVRQQRDRGTEVESSPTARIWLEESDAAFCMKSEPEPESPSSDAPATSRRRSTRLQHTSQPSYRAANVPFAVPISSEISYVATFSKKKYKFNDVLMTEDSVVGVQWQAKSQDRNIPSPGSLEVFRLS